MGVTLEATPWSGSPAALCADSFSYPFEGCPRLFRSLYAAEFIETNDRYSGPTYLLSEDHDRNRAVGLLKNALDLGFEIDALVDGAIVHAHQQQQSEMTVIHGSQNDFLGLAGGVMSASTRAVSTSRITGSKK